MYQTELDFAVRLAEKAGKIAREYFDSSLTIDYKSDDSPVTVADKTINQLVIDSVESEFPGDAILAEEGSHLSESNRFWVCDPIDGTSGFSIGCPTGLFSLAFVVDGEAKVAVVYDPYLGRLYSARLGLGASVNGQALNVSQREMSGSRIGCTSSIVEMNKTADYYAELMRLGARCFPYSGFVHQAMNVALGKLDARVYNGPMAHDVAAASLIVTEAGGKATDRRGKPLRLDGDVDGAIISNGLFHDQLIELNHKFNIASLTVRGPVQGKA